MSARNTNKDNFAERLCTNNNLAVFLLGMFFIIEDQGKNVLENRYGFFKADAMFAEVDFGFLLIPLEFHAAFLSIVNDYISR